MTSPLILASEGISEVKRHSRNVSYNLARRLTKGPLEADISPNLQDPLAPDSVIAEAANIPVPSTPLGPEPSAHLAPPLPPSKDFSYLLRPGIYHTLSQLDIPAPFRTPEHQPPPSTPIRTLLSRHHFRSAATAAALRLCTPPAPPPQELFSLLYSRLACLTLINYLPLAAEESKALQDINSPFYRDELTGESLLPWELRVLVVRLQGIGSGDARRGIGGYYDLAKEARAAANKCGGRAEEEEERRWKERLRELGLYIADALIETGDFAAAARHLESLRPRGGQDDTLDGRLALLHIHLGDVGAARRCLSNVGSADSQASLKPLLSMAEGRYTDAVEEWKALPKSDLATQNLAICLFYCGRVEETVNLLDGLVEKGRSFHALTFNLATVYELCSERGMERKGKLVGRVAKAIEQKGGGERGVIDFKM